MYYAGIGSRKTPKNILNEMVDIAYGLSQRGWILRSGGAKGADWAFESGAMQGMGVPEIYLPWKGYNKHLSQLYEIPEEAFVIARKHHPRYTTLGPAIRKLMARNCQQVLGKNLDSPSKFVVCWTPDGVENGEETSASTGGTGQAIRVATAYNIPVFNLKIEDSVERMVDFIQSMKEN